MNSEQFSVQVAPTTKERDCVRTRGRDFSPVKSLYFTDSWTEVHAPKEVLTQSQRGGTKGVASKIP